MLYENCLMGADNGNIDLFPYCRASLKSTGSGALTCDRRPPFRMSDQRFFLDTTNKLDQDAPVY